MDKVINYNPIFVTDTSSFDYFSVFMSNLLSFHNTKNLWCYYLIITVLFISIFYFYLSAYLQELYLIRQIKFSKKKYGQGLSLTDAEQTSSDGYKQILDSHLTHTYTCAGDILHSSSGHTYQVADDCLLLLGTLNKQL